MSRSFLGFPLNTYQQSLTPFPTKLCGQSGIVIPVSINWANYNASSTAPNNNQTVIVNLTGNAAQSALPNVRSVFIDNTNSNVPIYVFFPDTGHSVTCAPNAEVWAPVYTNGLIAWIIGEGFVTGQIPSTLVLFTNIFVQPFTNYELAQTVDLWKASQTITRGENVFNSDHGSPSLCDTTTSIILSGTGTINIPFIMNTGYVYLNVMQLVVSGQAPNAGDQQTVSIIRSGTAQEIWRWDYFTISNVNYSFNMPVVSGLNLKLDLTQGPYNLQTVIVGGFSAVLAVLQMGITYNPT